MPVETFIKNAPKVELHVHLEGAIPAHTLLKLAHKNNIALPVSTLEEIREWYRFRDFPDFNEKYILISNCIRNSDDIYLIGKEFLEGQAAQHIVYSEVTYTAYTHTKQWRIPMLEQISALMEASRWAEQHLGVGMRLIIDIARETAPHEGLWVAEAAVEGMPQGVVALGLGGYEVGYPPGRFVEAFALAREAGLPRILHAGETAGAESIREALEVGDPLRIGHGVRCLEDAGLVAELRARQIPLEICPSSNVCLGVVPDMHHHPLPRLLQEGLFITINSDDPALFSTSLIREYTRIRQAFDYDIGDLQKLMVNGIQASFLSPMQKSSLLQEMDTLITREN
ncbi:MAG: adenosine deaminase [Chloroflexi bacterium]|nr:adenosine deaminase [Chloroflexota bacterium]